MMATTPAPAAIACQGMVKRFGRREVLTGIDLTVQPGEFFAMVGANGAGKTTLLKSILDLCAIQGGEIRIQGISHLQPTARASLAYLPERFIPPYFLTGREFLQLLTRMYGHKVQIGDIRTVLGELGLEEEAMERPVRQYSKGMTQKLGLAACLLSRKEILILDEPMSGLDPKARALFKRKIAALHTAGRTLFFNTHLLEDVEQLCTRMAILHRGRILFIGSPQACCQQFGTTGLEEAYLRCLEQQEEKPQREIA